ncbi:hypothetical protein TNCV_3890031 [Trichonephila clavipes]|nr:hypothetical protein TNCV_3890031 [Trichonephila clavipes]
MMNFVGLYLAFAYQVALVTTDNLESDHISVNLTLYTGSALIKVPDQFSINWENFKLLNNKPFPIPPSSSNDDLKIELEGLEEISLKLL